MGIGMMGALSWVTSFMVWALATKGWMMYLATGLSSIGGLTSTPIVTLLTKLVDKEEMGAVMAMCSGMFCLQMLLSSIVFTQVYRLTLATLPGAIFFIMAAIYTLLAFLFLVNLLVLFRQEKRYGLLDKEEMVPATEKLPHQIWYNAAS